MRLNYNILVFINLYMKINNKFIFYKFKNPETLEQTGKSEDLKKTKRILKLFFS